MACLTMVAMSMQGCKKDTADTGTTTEQLLEAGKWKFSAAKINGLDAAPLLQGCQKDNLISFYNTPIVKTGDIDEGGTKCSSSDPQTRTFSWAVANNVLTIESSAPIFAGGSNKFTLVKVSATELVISQGMAINIGSDPQVVEITFIH
jgi:Lipocalin-like domain